MTLPPLKPGDKVFVVHQRQRGQKEHRTETCEVVRVGSKYAYIKRYRREAAFFKNTGVSVHQDNNARLNGYGFDVYATEQDWLREQHEESEEARLTERLERNRGCGLIKLPPLVVAAIHAVLDENNIAKEST